MRRASSHALLGLLLATAAGTLLLAAILRLLAGAQPVAAAAAQQASGLQITQQVATGSGAPDVAFNGQFITYTITLVNNSGNTLSDVQVLDQLPFDTLTNITCLGPWPCNHIFETKLIPEPLGGTLMVTVTRQITWAVSSIPAGGTALLQFSGRVAGQADGTTVTNVASVLRINGLPVSGLTANAVVTVRVPLDNQGQAEISNAATWFSSDLGGTLSQDWGDLNRDGNLDLVLGSSVGTSVFINENGRLRSTKLWGNDKRTYGVAFADFNGDGRLDVVAVGDSEGGQTNGTGYNYIYGQLTDPVTLSPTFGLSSTFVSTYQLVRVAVGDFDNDGDVDIVGSTNTLNAACPVLLFRNGGAGQFTTPSICVSTGATAAIGPGDYDNDGDLDLALGVFPDAIKVFRNVGGVLTETNTATVDDGLPFLPYDFAWGDYSNDGNLDLAAAFPLQKEARIFRNLGANTFDTLDELIFRTASFLTPLAVDWGDFNGDGLLDLMVADEAPKIYLRQPLGQGQAFSDDAVISSDPLLGQKWGLNAVQLDSGGDLSLAVTNRDRPSVLLQGFTSHLASGLTRLTTKRSGSVAWGDADNDKDVDLLFGAGDGTLGTTLYYNTAGTISSTNLLDLSLSGIGPHHVAFGDVNGDRSLEIVVATPGSTQLYQPGSTQPTWSTDAASHVAFTDANSDGRLDLLAATAGGGISLYLNQNGALNPVAAFVTQQTGEVRSLSVADFNRDFYPDFAVAFVNAPARVFLNNKNNTFTQVWTSGTVLDTRAVAWGDFNADGYADLAVGHYQAGTQLFRNMTGTLSANPIWTSPTFSKTTALAWGDWDNDGFPDLAVGNDGEPTQVFGNLNSTYALPRLFWLWSSRESYATTGLAWGDVDGDGDMDLGYSQASATGFSGYYRNGTISPSHHSNLAADYLDTMPLPNNPPYVFLPRPGNTGAAYLWSSSEVLGLGGSPTLTILYTQYDPDGARRTSETNGDPLARTVFEFSLDGGATWKRASGVSGAPPAITSTHRLGVLGSFIWDARRDQAISDDARFRVRVVPQLKYGPTQRASTTSISPPFRVRALAAGCIWPDGPNISVSANPPVPGATTYLTGTLLSGTGPLTYTWQFSDRITPTLGQVTSHQFMTATTYSVTLTVTGPACPVTRPVMVTRVWGATGLTPRLFIPLMMRNVASAASASDPVAEPTSESTTETPTPEVTATETITATETATPTETVTATETATEAATSTPTDAPTEIPTQAPTETATPEATSTASPEPTSTETPTTTASVGGLSALVPQVGVSLHSSGGQPTLRMTAPQVAALSSHTTLLFVTNPANIGISNEPAISGDGKYVAFWSTANLAPSVGNADGNIELFLAQMGSPIQFTQVTNSTGSILGGFNLSPSIDESGTRVAFFSDRDLVGQNPESSFQIFLYDSTTLTLTQVTTRTRGFNILPSLSGNGQFIAFVTDRNYAAATDGTTEAEGNSEIALAALGPGGTIRVTPVTTTTNRTNDQPRIDHSGTRIAFVSNADLVPGQNLNGNREVFVATLQPNGSVVYTQVTNTSLGTTDQVAISRDGRYVVFVSDQDPDGSGPAVQTCQCPVVYRATLNSAGQVTAIVAASSNNNDLGLSKPTISADGTRIAYLRSLAPDRLYLRDMISGADTTIDVADNSLNPILSGSGTAVAFASQKQIMWAEFPLAELSVGKSVAPLVAFPGDLLRYTIVVTNAGPSAATGVRVTDVLSSTALSFAASPDQIDNSSGAGGFGAPGSTHLNTTWSTSPSPAALTLASGLNGTYTSRVMDAGSVGAWTQLTWTPRRPYGKPLPNNGASETAYTQGNFSLAGLLALLHLDEGGGVETYANNASTVSPPGRCSTSLGTCPQPAAGQFNGAAQFTGNPTHLDVDVLPAAAAYGVSFWFNTLCADCGLFQVGQGQLGNLARDRQLVLDNGQVCVILSNETICASGLYNDGQWHHVAHVYGNPAQSSGQQQLYVDGLLRNTGVVSASTLLDDAILNVGYALASPFDLAHDPYFTGSLDELAVFTRSLTPAEIQDLYLRGIQRLQFQVRTCGLVDCSDGGPFTGPGGLNTTAYSEAGNQSAGLPGLDLTGLPDGRYFQYQVVLSTSDAAQPPRLQRVEVGPSHGAIETRQGFCGSPTVGASTTSFTCSLNDLAAGQTATVTVQLTPTNYGLLTNNVWASSDVEEHNPVNFAAVSPNVLPLPIQAFTVTLAGAPGLAGQGTAFTATVAPISASVPITYLWQATNQIPVTRTGGLTNTNVFTWFTGGPQVVTVTAINAANVLSNTPGLTASLNLVISNPVPSLTQISPASALINSSDVTLVITGSQFVGTSQVRWNTSTTLSATVGSSTRITATVPASLLTTAGQFPIRIFNPAPAGGFSPQTLTFTVNHPTPANLVLNPSTAVAGTSGFSLVVTGTDFFPGAQLFWNGSARTTVVDVPSQTLTATITAADIAAVGTRTITVTNPAPNTGASAGVSFPVTALGLTLAPPTTSLGLNEQATLTATISAVQAANRTLTLTSSSPLVTVPSTVLFPAGSTQVTFTVSSGNLGASATITGTLPVPQGAGQDTVQVIGLNPTPVITGTNPVTASAGGIALSPLQIFATNVVPGVQVYWNGTQLISSLSGNVISAQVPASFIQFTNTATITAVNPIPNTGASAGFSFVTGLPSLTLTPATISTTVNSTVLMTVTTDTPRASATLVTLASSNPTVASVPANVTIPAGSASATFNLTAGGVGGNASITATLPAAYGSISDTTAVEVNNSAPVITSLVPNPVTAGGSTFTLRINGSGFVGNSQVWRDGVQFSPSDVTFVNSTHLSVTVNSSLIANAGQISITVRNNPPPAGGLISNAEILTVQNPAPVITAVGPQTATVGGPAFTLNVTGTNFISGAQLFFGGVGRTANVAGGGASLTATINANEIDTLGSVVITMTNPSPTLPSASSVPFTITQLGLNLLPGTTFTLTSGQTAPMTVTLSAVQAAPTVVTLTSSLPGSVAVPPTVSVPAGQLSASFTITATSPGTSNVQAALPASLGGATDTTPVGVVDAALAGLVVANSSPTDMSGNSATVFFTATLSTGTNVNYTWAWGDGLPNNTGPSPTRFHIYGGPAGGVYTAVITATNSVNTITATSVVTLNHLAPTLTSMSPMTFPVNSSAQTLVITGTRFYTGTVVNINGSPRTPVIFGPNYTTMTVQLAATDLNTAGTFNVTARSPNPPTPGLLSAQTLTFRVLQLTATNSGPVDRGTPVTLQANLNPSVPISYTWSPGDGSGPFTGNAAFVHNYPSALGGVYTAVVTATAGATGPVTASTIVTINNLTPTISAFSPMAQNGNPGFTLTVTGTNFIAGTQINWEGFGLISTTIISSTRLTASIPGGAGGGSAIPTAGTYDFTVVAPAPPAVRRESAPVQFVRT